MLKAAGEGPPKRVGVDAIPSPDEAEDGALEVGVSGERAVAQHAALQNREPDFDLVDPRSVKRREHEVEAPAVPKIESRPALRLPLLVDVEVVPDNVDLRVGVSGSDILKEATSASAVRCLTTFPITSPVATSNEASSEHVPWRTYSNSRLTLASGALVLGCFRVSACIGFSSMQTTMLPGGGCR